MIVGVTVATGACAGEKEETKDEIEPDLVTIVQEGDSITVVGLGCRKGSQVCRGKIDEDRVTFGDVWEEDNGVTTASFTMVIDFATRTMSGVEAWTREGPGDRAPKARVR